MHDGCRLSVANIQSSQLTGTPDGEEVDVVLKVVVLPNNVARYLAESLRVRSCVVKSTCTTPKRSLYPLALRMHRPGIAKSYRGTRCGNSLR